MVALKVEPLGEAFNAEEEQRTENPCVHGSIPGGTTFKKLIIKQLLIKVAAFSFIYYPVLP